MKVPKARKLKSGSWFIQLRLDGQSVPVTGTSERDVTNKAALLKAQYMQLGRLEKRKAGALTLTEAIDRYISERTNILSPETIRGYRIIQRNRFRSRMDKPLSADDWQRAVNEEAARLAPKTVWNSWMLVVSVLKSNGIAPPQITLPMQMSEEHPFLQPEQIKPFLDAMRDDPAELSALFALHSLRLSEFRILKKSDIRDGMIYVSGAQVRDEHNNYVIKKQNKTVQSARCVPIIIPRLQELIDSREEIFQLSEGRIRQHINDSCERAGLPQVGIHGLRHSFCSLCYHLGVSEAETMRLGGWSDPTVMRKIYTHLAEIDKQSANAKLKAFFSPDQTPAPVADHTLVPEESRSAAP